MLKGDELRARAEELGVSMGRLYDSDGHISEPELQRRVLEAERANRESRLWLIALISAIASVVSAIAACVAVLKT
jgi:hypothetical protein